MASKKTRLSKKTLWLLGGLLAVESMACIGVGIGAHSRKTAMENTLAGRQKELADIRAVSASLPALRAEYTRMQDQVRFLEASLPPAEFIPTLLGQVEQTARACGVTIQEIRPKEETKAPGGGPNEEEKKEDTGAQQVMFEMVVHGKYGQMQNFLQSLTRFRKILALQQMNLTPTDSGTAGKSPSLAGKLSLTAYVLAPAPPAEKPGVGEATVEAAASAARQAAAERGLTPRTEGDAT